jgi:hypothetical protein
VKQINSADLLALRSALAGAYRSTIPVEEWIANRPVWPNDNATPKFSFWRQFVRRRFGL